MVGGGNVAWLNLTQEREELVPLIDDRFALFRRCRSSLDVINLPMVRIWFRKKY